jgi:hypothetical protein
LSMRYFETESSSFDINYFFCVSAVRFDMTIFGFGLYIYYMLA